MPEPRCRGKVLWTLGVAGKCLGGAGYCPKGARVTAWLLWCSIAAVI